jgi:hypothetical protein
VYRDVLIREPAQSRPLAHPVLWTETGHDVLARGTVARFANLWWDGPDNLAAVQVGYAEGTDHTDCAVDDDGAIVQHGAHRRRARAGAELPLTRRSS